MLSTGGVYVYDGGKPTPKIEAYTTPHGFVKGLEVLKEPPTHKKVNFQQAAKKAIKDVIKVLKKGGNPELSRGKLIAISSTKDVPKEYKDLIKKFKVK